MTYTYDDMRNEIMSHLKVRPNGYGAWKVSTYVKVGPGERVYDWFITHDEEDYRGAEGEDPQDWRERMADRFLDDEWYHNGCPDGIEFDGDWDNISGGEFIVGEEEDIEESRRPRDRMLREESEKKYELTDEKKKSGETTLYRIRALKSFGNVKTGELGGWIESEKNLSQKDACWVYGDAAVYGDAQVYEDARVSYDAKVFDNAKVYGRAKVTENAGVFGNAQVYGNALVYGDAAVYGNAKVYGNARVYGGANVRMNAQVYGDALVYGNASVHGDAKVYGDAWVRGFAQVGDRKVAISRGIKEAIHTRHGRMLKEAEEQDEEEYTSPELYDYAEAIGKTMRHVYNRLKTFGPYLGPNEKRDIMDALRAADKAVNDVYDKVL